LLAAVRVGIDFTELCPKQKYLSSLLARADEVIE
jgi:hypothetical protein